MSEEKTYRRKRNIPICIRLSEKESEELEKRLQKIKLDKTNYLIKILLGKKIYVNNFDQDLKALVFELNKIGINLKQIAKNLNASIYEDLAKELRCVNERQIEVYNKLLKFMDAVNIVSK